MADLLPEGDFEEDEGLTKLGLWITFIVIVLILGLAGAGYYLFQMLRAEQSGLGGKVGKESQRVLDLSHQVTSLQKEMTTLHAQVTLLESKQAAREKQWRKMLDQQAQVFDEKLEALDQKLALSHTKLAQQIQFVQRQINRTRADVMLTDAEYLLSVANQKLNLTGDVGAALKAMEAADDLLRHSGDPSVYKVREALARELAALKKIKAPDPVGISARILVLEDKIHGLPLFLPHMGKVTEHGASRKQQAKQPADEDLIEQWKEILTIRRRQTERPVEAILTPEEVEAIRHALVLKLETARFAAVRGEPELYRDSLGAAVKWLKQHFKVKDPKVQTFISELNDLAKQPVAVQLPEIGSSLKLLRHLPQLRLELERIEVPKVPKVPQARAVAPAKVSNTMLPRPVPTPRAEQQNGAGMGDTRKQPEATTAPQPTAEPQSQSQSQ